MRNSKLVQPLKKQKKKEQKYLKKGGGFCVAGLSGAAPAAEAALRQTNVQIPVSEKLSRKAIKPFF